MENLVDNEVLEIVDVQEPEQLQKNDGGKWKRNRIILFALLISAVTALIVLGITIPLASSPAVPITTAALVAGNKTEHLGNNTHTPPIVAPGVQSPAVLTKTLAAPEPSKQPPEIVTSTAQPPVVLTTTTAPKPSEQPPADNNADDTDESTEDASNEYTTATENDDDANDDEDNAITPCDDFYVYCCQDWIKTHEQVGGGLLDDGKFGLSVNSVTTFIQETMSAPVAPSDSYALTTAKNYYQSCVRAEPKMVVEQLLQRLSSINGGLPLLKNFPHTKHLKVNDAIKAFAGVGGYAGSSNNVFFHDKGLFRVTAVGQSSSGRASIWLSPPANEIFNNDKSNLRRILMELDHEHKDSYMEPRVTLTTTSEIDQKGEQHKAERELGKLESFLKLLRSPSKSEGSFSGTVSEFVELLTEGQGRNVTEIDWFGILKTVYPDLETTDEVSVESPNYFQALEEILPHTSTATLRHFMIISLFDMFATQQSSSTSLSLKEKCSQILKSDDAGPLFPLIFVVGQQYVLQHNITIDDIEEMTQLAILLRQTFVKHIRKSHWIDPKSKERLEEHLTNVNLLVGFPTWILDSTALDDFYSSLLMSPEPSDYVENHLRLLSFQASQGVVSWDFVAGSTQIYEDAPFLSVSPEYIYSTKVLSIPAGGFGSSFFGGEKGLRVGNFGALASIIGHEMAHAIYTYLDMFQSGTSQTRNRLWGFKSTALVEEKIGCTQEQYARLAILAGLKLTGTTLEEDISDNVGTMMAFDAFQEWKFGSLEDDGDTGANRGNFTRDQQFFLSYGKIWCSHLNSVEGETWRASHSEDNLRVLGTIINNKDFAKVWSCPSKSPMNPEKRCSLWEIDI